MLSKVDCLGYIVSLRPYGGSDSSCYASRGNDGGEKGAKLHDGLSLKVVCRGLSTVEEAGVQGIGKREKLGQRFYSSFVVYLGGEMLFTADI